MMDLATIIAVNEEIAAEAARRNLQPFVPNGEAEVERWPPFPFPSVGRHDPGGWEQTDTTWFVDRTGVGRDWEPALTVDQFKRALKDHITSHPGHAFAVVEEGPFQVIVAAFRPVATAKTA